MEEGTQVTFVGGKAAEQTTSGESATPPDERAAAIEAVKAALREEGESAAKEAKESVRKSRKASGFETQDEEAAEPAKAKAEPGKAGRDESGRFTKKDETEGGQEESSELSVRKVLTERKQLAQYKQQQSQAIQEQFQQLKAFQHQLAAQQRELQAERERLAELRKDPGRVIREIGYDPEEFILDLAREGTPEGQAARKQREYERQLKEMHEWKRQQDEQREAAKRQYEEQRSAAYRQHVEREFVGVATSEKFPMLSNFYKGREQMLIAQGDIIADHYRELTGKDASFEDIAEYLEGELSTRYNALVGNGSGRQAGSAVTRGRSTQGATGRTLSPDASSERRSLGAQLKDLDGDERLAAAREAVGAALRASGEKT